MESCLTGLWWSLFSGASLEIHVPTSPCTLLDDCVHRVTCERSGSHAGVIQFQRQGRRGKVCSPPSASPFLKQGAFHSRDAQREVLPLVQRERAPGYTRAAFAPMGGLAMLG
ncbi:hypothetical protein E2C01_002957 [Portunus trituberculatus]|uniref:Secreted protein n=1 Tax=Portunus trituberculatus TaxID=210409 RepID=A0A5B7CS36_PORTR|nr:hypothetical protein [Portunus trituberculatus]